VLPVLHCTVGAASHVLLYAVQYNEHAAKKEAAKATSEETCS